MFLRCGSVVLIGSDGDAWLSAHRRSNIVVLTSFPKQSRTNISSWCSDGGDDGDSVSTVTTMVADDGGNDGAGDGAGDGDGGDSDDGDSDAGNGADYSGGVDHGEAFSSAH